MIRTFMAWFILLGLPAVLLGDWLAYKTEGYDATITAITREWADRSVVPEVIFLLSVLVLWVHIFRRWI